MSSEVSLTDFDLHTLHEGVLRYGFTVYSTVLSSQYDLVRL